MRRRGFTLTELAGAIWFIVVLGATIFVINMVTAPSPPKSEIVSSDVPVDMPVDTPADAPAEAVTFKGHLYVRFYGRVAGALSVVHDPDCPCFHKKAEQDATP